MGVKSRGNYPVKACLKKCANRDIKCHKCIRFSEYREMKYHDRLSYTGVKPSISKYIPNPQEIKHERIPDERILTCKNCGKKIKVSGYICNDTEYLCALCRK